MTIDQASEILKIPKILISEIVAEQNMPGDLDIHDLAEIDLIYRGQSFRKRRVGDWHKKADQLAAKLKDTKQKLEQEKRRADLLESKLKKERKTITKLNWYPNKKKVLVREEVI